MAENCTCHLHNLYTPARRPGARRQGLELLHRRGDRRCSPPRPRCSSPATTGRAGAARTRERFLTTQRDLYKYVHDQTLRMANHGLTPKEIAEDLALPPTLAARVAHPRLLRHAQPQRQGGLPALPRLVRRQPGQPAPAAAGRGGQALRRARRRRRRAAGQGAGGVRGRRLPLGGRGGEPPGVRRPGQRGGPRAAGRRAGAARLPGRVRALARLLPHRRAGAAQPPRAARRAAPGCARPSCRACRAPSCWTR